jgi:hypothetical protein
MVNERSMMHSDSGMRSHGSARSWNSGKASALSKCKDLYQDAKRRYERKTNIYSNCIDAECTFKPDTAATRSQTRRMSAKRSEKMSVFEKLS